MKITLHEPQPRPETMEEQAVLSHIKSVIAIGILAFIILIIFG